MYLTEVLDCPRGEWRGEKTSHVSPSPLVRSLSRSQLLLSRSQFPEFLWAPVSTSLKQGSPVCLTYLSSPVKSTVVHKNDTVIDNDGKFIYYSLFSEREY